MADVKKKKKKKPKKWCLRRHSVVTELARHIYGPIIYKKYNVKIDPFEEQGDRPYLILFNHQTAYDQFFVGLCMKRPVYYVASEDLFSMGNLSRLLRFAVNPIPIKKQTTDPRAVINCIKVAKEGGTIALAPEGNRTFHGKPVYIKPSIAALAKHLKLPIAFFRIEGGYGVHPRWSDVVRGGSMRAGVRRVMEPEEYAHLSDEELCEIINRELAVDEAVLNGEYPHERQAEFLERALYVCPDCGLSVLRSEKDIIECTRCGKKVRHLPTKELEGVGCEIPFRFVADWYEYQCRYVRGLELTSYLTEPMYTDKVDIFRVILYKKKATVCKNAEIRLFGDRIVASGDGYEREFKFADLSAVTVLGKNKLNVYIGDEVYQFRGDARFCALKYVNIFYHHRSAEKGEENEFLGL